MIFKAFKQKSNLKHMNKLLSAKSVVVNNKKINALGVIINLNEFSDFDALRNYFKTLGLKENQVKIIAFVEDDKKANKLWNTYFNPKDFGWKGKINNIELQQFIDSKFDALLAFYNEDILELNLITALSQANFKIGLSNKDARLFDLIINVTTKEFSVFKTELKKYLTVLNKI